MAIANGTCVYNQPKTQFWLPQESHVGMSLPSPVLRVEAFGYRKSLRHIGLPGYALAGTIAVNVTWMKRGFNACQTHCSMYPSIFNRFPVIQPVSLKVRHFSTFWPPLGWVRLVAYTHLFSTISEIYSKLLVFISHLCLAPPRRG